MESIVVAGERHRQMDVSQRMRNGLAQRIGEFNERCRILRLDEMLGAEITITKMHAKLDIRRHSRAEPHYSRQDLIPRLIAMGNSVRLLAVPDAHLVADVPLNAKIAMRNMTAKRRYFR